MYVAYTGSNVNLKPKILYINPHTQHRNENNRWWVKRSMSLLAIYIYSVTYTKRKVSYKQTMLSDSVTGSTLGRI